MSDILSSSSTRVKTGVALGIALLIVGFIDSFFIMWLLLGALMMIGINEAMRLFESDNDLIYYYAGAVWIVAAFYPKPEDLVFLIAIIFASILAYTRDFDKGLFLPLLYPVASFLFLLSLYSQFGMMSLLWLLVVVAGTDIGAYYSGKSFGKTKFCETSPNKTIEGVIGGVAAASILGVIFSLDSIGLFSALIISILVSLSSVFGDLFESYLKREAEVKDSGDLLPGHGGILDRTDGYLFGGVVMLILLRFVA